MCAKHAFFPAFMKLEIIVEDKNDGVGEGLRMMGHDVDE